MGDQTERIRQALEQTCPRCKAPAGMNCSRPNGSFLPDDKVHKAREDAAARLRDDDGPPAALATNASRVQWRDYSTTLRQRNDWTPGNRRMLLAALRFTEEAEAALARAAEEPECVGSTGQLVANPNYAVATRCTDKMLAILEALRLTPRGAIAANAGGRSPVEVGDELDELDAARRRRSGK